MVCTFGHGNHGSTMVFYTMCRTVSRRMTIFQTGNFYLNIRLHESLDYTKITLPKPLRPSYQAEEIGNQMEREMACGASAWLFDDSISPPREGSDKHHQYLDSITKNIK